MVNTTLHALKMLKTALNPKFILHEYLHYQMQSADYASCWQNF